MRLVYWYLPGTYERSKVHVMAGADHLTVCGAIPGASSLPWREKQIIVFDGLTDKLTCKACRRKARA